MYVIYVDKFAGKEEHYFNGKVPAALEIKIGHSIDLYMFKKIIPLFSAYKFNSRLGTLKNNTRSIKNNFYIKIFLPFTFSSHASLNLTRLFIHILRAYIFYINPAQLFYPCLLQNDFSLSLFLSFFILLFSLSSPLVRARVD